METQFEFEELCPVIDDKIVRGMMLYGTATLVSNDPTGSPYEFYVKRVELDGGLVLTETGGVPRGHFSVNKALFKAVADIIENGKHPLGRAAQDEFNEAVDEGRQPDPDAARDERRDAAFDFRGEPPALRSYMERV